MTLLLICPRTGSKPFAKRNGGAFGKTLARMSLSDLHRKPGHLIRRLQQIAVALFMLETGRT